MNKFFLLKKYHLAFALIDRNANKTLMNLNENESVIITENDLKELEKNEGEYCKIAIYRHPFNRLESVYNWYILNNNYHELLDYFRMYNKTFDEFIKFVNFTLNSGNNADIYNIIKPQSNLFDINYIDKIIDINILDEFLYENFGIIINNKDNVSIKKNVYDYEQYENLINSLYYDDLNLIKNDKYISQIKHKEINENDLVSFIMPLYNTSKYLRKCLDSIKCQTYKNWECIIVDDVSTDGSYEIALEYAENDKRFKVYRNESNLGCGLNRRKAISLGSGKWFTFIDSDDYIDSTFIYEMLTACIKTNSEISICGNETLDENYNITSVSVSPNGYISSKESLYRDYMTTDWIKQYNGNKFYSKRVIDLVEYCDLRYCEDSVTTYKWLWEANQAVIVPKALFHYVQHMDSNSNNNNNLITKCLDTCKCVYDHWLFCKQNNFEYMYNPLKEFIHYYYITLIYKLETNSDILKYLSFIKKEMNLL